MKVAIIGSTGSGGLMTYLKGLFSVLPECQTRVFGDERFFKEFDKYLNGFEKQTVQHHERGKDILFNKKLSGDLINKVRAFDPSVVLFTSGWVRRGLEEYPNIMVLHNQLYIDNKAFLQTLNVKNILSLTGFRTIVRRSMRNADGVIFLSERSKRNTDMAGIRYKTGKVIYFGLNAEDIKFSPGQFNGDKIRLLYVSTFYAYKKHEKLFAAVKLLKDKGYNIELRLVGKGPQAREEILKRLAKKLDINDDLAFCGWLAHDEVNDEMDKADVFVYPSSVESTGLGVMEAMARGKSIACSDMSCMPEILKDAGLYFDPQNEKEIADAIERLITDDLIRKNLSRKAFEYAKEYTWDNAVKAHYDYLAEFAKQ